MPSWCRVEEMCVHKTVVYWVSGENNAKPWIVLFAATQHIQCFMFAGGPGHGFIQNQWHTKTPLKQPTIWESDHFPIASYLSLYPLLIHAYFISSIALFLCPSALCNLLFTSITKYNTLIYKGIYVNENQYAYHFSTIPYCLHWTF